MDSSIELSKPSAFKFSINLSMSDKVCCLHRAVKVSGYGSIRPELLGIFDLTTVSIRLRMEHSEATIRYNIVICRIPVPIGIILLQTFVPWTTLVLEQCSPSYRTDSLEPA